MRRLLWTRPKVSISFVPSPGGAFRVRGSRGSCIQVPCRAWSRRGSVAQAVRSHAERGNEVGGVSRAWVDPLDAAVGPVFFLPDGHEFLKAVDGVAAGVERLAAVRAADGDGHAHL